METIPHFSPLSEGKSLARVANENLQSISQVVTRNEWTLTAL